jgi:hypothetical protein
MSKKLSPAQARILQEVIKVTDDGYRAWSCFPEYKPALKLLELKYVSKVETSSSSYRIILVPTELGRSVASSLSK